MSVKCLAVLQVRGWDLEGEVFVPPGLQVLLERGREVGVKQDPDYSKRTRQERIHWPHSPPSLNCVPVQMVLMVSSPNGQRSWRSRQNTVVPGWHRWVARTWMTHQAWVP